MKKMKLILGLTLSLGLLASMGTIEKSSVTNAGWAFSRFCNSNQGVEVASEAGFGALGAYAGAEYGAEIGLEVGQEERLQEQLLVPYS